MCGTQQAWNKSIRDGGHFCYVFVMMVVDVVKVSIGGAFYPEAEVAGLYIVHTIQKGCEG